ncbi:hypothetical protein FQN49_000595 [Arthroderma sp. PD_2]|nr:hypothetical protein FQN49_000595 [Arthroderma sp. PD_2]
MDKGEVEIIQVPQGPVTPSNLAALCNRFRTSRLKALYTYPEAFSSTHADESAFPDEKWAERLQNPMARTYAAVCVENGDTADDVEKLTNNEWMGMVVLLGPKVFVPDSTTRYPWEPITAGGMQKEAEGALRDAEAAYFAVSMFVLPGATKRGIGQKLIATMMKGAREDARAELAWKLHVSLLVESDNETAGRLYERCGFRHVETESPVKGLGASIALKGMTWNEAFVGE